jgi:subtilisin family serine protease
VSARPADRIAPLATAATVIASTVMASTVMASTVIASTVMVGALVSGCLLASVSTASAASMPSTTTPNRAAQWWLTALGVPQAWKATASARPGKGITVAILSTGVDPSHPDLNDSVTTGPDYSKSGASPGDQYWGVEGTAVASLIAGHGHGHGGTQGITGVAPGARILSLRVTLEYNDSARNANPAITRGLPDAIAAGIRYAVSHGASVIALPLDPGTLGPLMTGDPTAAGGSAAEQAAVKAALAANVVLVAPAGDNAASTGIVTYPAAYPGVIAVGATDAAGHLESFSSTRPYVALTAPGGGLTAAAPGGGYATIQTTDMSAALTAGVAVLIRARYPRLSEAQVAKAIELGTTAEAAGTPKAGTGHGALNAARALTEAASIAATLPSPAATASPFQPYPAPSTASPATGQRGPATGQLATSQSGLGGTARAILRDAAIGAGILIAALTGLLLLARSRRRRAHAERLGQAASRTSTAQPGRPGGRAPTGGFPAITGGFQSFSRHGAHAAARGTDRPGDFASGTPRAIGPAAGQRATGSAGGPRAIGPADGPATPRPRPHQSPNTRTGPLSSLGRPPIRPDIPYDSVPWEPALRPAEESHDASYSQALEAMMRPPWEPEPLAAAPVPEGDDPAPRKAHTGPMYVWNPDTNSGPFPALPDD